MNIKSIMEIREIFAKRKNEVYPISLALKIVRFLESTQTVEALFRERQARIFDECVEKDENGAFIPTKGGYKLRPEKVKKYEEEMQELMLGETEDTISFSEKEAEALSLTLDELAAVSDFLEV